MTEDEKDLMWAIKAGGAAFQCDEGCRMYHLISQVGEVELEYEIYAHSEAEAEWKAMYIMAYYLDARAERRKRRNNGRKKNVRQEDS